MKNLDSCLRMLGLGGHWLIFWGVIFWHSSVFAQPTNYIVDPVDSYVHIYTDTSGLLETFGHKHLIAITEISGEIEVSDQGSQATLTVRPENFLVDDEVERARAADPEYREPVSERVRTGTQKNMLGEYVLNSVNYPEISVDVQLARLSASPLLQVSITILGEKHSLQIPAIMEVSRDHIHASGYFELNHSDLGLEPFAAVGGLLKVGEELRMQFEIVADSRHQEMIEDQN